MPGDFDTRNPEPQKTKAVVTSPTSTTVWNLLKQAKALRIPEDTEGDLWTLPVIGVDPTTGNPFQTSSAGDALSSGIPAFAAYASNGTTEDRMLNWTVGGGDADATTKFNSVLLVASRNTLFNGTTWDRQRGNQDVNLLASAARTATTNGADQTNYNARGILLHYDVTAVSGTTPTLAPSVQAKDTQAAIYATLWTAAANITATGHYVYVLYPAAVAGSTEAVNRVIPRTWRTVDTIGGTTPSFTYSSTVSPIL